MVLSHVVDFDGPVATKVRGYKGMWYTPLQPKYPCPAAASALTIPHGRDLGQVLSQIAPMQRGRKTLVFSTNEKVLFRSRATALGGGVEASTAT